MQLTLIINIREEAKWVHIQVDRSSGKKQMPQECSLILLCPWYKKNEVKKIVGIIGVFLF